MGCGCGGGSFRGSTPRRSSVTPTMQANMARPVSIPHQSQGVQSARAETAPEYIVQSQVLAARRANAVRRQV